MNEYDISRETLANGKTRLSVLKNGEVIATVEARTVLASQRKMNACLRNMGETKFALATK
jgi:hypothetical protein